MRLGDQNAPVGSGAQHFAARAALRERHSLQRRHVHHLERGAFRLAVRQVRRHEKQTFETRAVPAECD